MQLVAPAVNYLSKNMLSFKYNVLVLRSWHAGSFAYLWQTEHLQTLLETKPTDIIWIICLHWVNQKLEWNSSVWFTFSVNWLTIDWTNSSVTGTLGSLSKYSSYSVCHSSCEPPCKVVRAALDVQLFVAGLHPSQHRHLRRRGGIKGWPRGLIYCDKVKIRARKLWMEAGNEGSSQI